MTEGRTVAVWLVLASAVACGPPAPEPLPDDALAFGVFADGPYYMWEEGRFRRAMQDMERSEIGFLIHAGDILAHPCSDELYTARRDELNGADFPVVYTPGDNEWTDCHREGPGGYDPLERLAALRSTFFADPERSLGARPMRLVSQAGDSAYAGFPENARWRAGGLTFATAHVVGSSNGLDPWAGRTEAHDAEVERRTAAAVGWIHDTFDAAERDSATAVVLAFHAEPGLTAGNPTTGFEPILVALRDRTAAFDRAVLVVHGDDHVFTVDQPLADSAGRPLQNFTRLETFGSPEIGWVRVVVDTVAGTFEFQPRLMRGWW